MDVFLYGEETLEYLREKDKKLAQAIDLIGPIRRQVRPDLFAALVNSIVGQQISSKAQKTIYGRMETMLGEITPDTICEASLEDIQSCGISMRKAGYIQDLGRRVRGGDLDLQGLYQLSDEEVIRQLSRLKGIGEWTAEMILIFSMQRPDVLSFGDLAIQRGLRMLYRHKSIDRALFDRYRRRYSPHASVASLYLWEIAGGDYGYTDPAAEKQKAEKSKKASSV